MTSRRWLYLLSLVGLLCLAPGGAWGQQKGEDEDLAFWGDTRRRQAAAAAQVVGARDPYLTLALRITGKRYAIWNEREFAFDWAPALDPVWLKRIQDKSFVPDLSKRALITEIKESEWAYRTIARDALIKSFNTPDDVFRDAAGEYAKVKWEQLDTHPDFYRGKVVGIEGKLRKLVKDPAPADISPPIEHVYQAWIETPTNPRPVIVLFSVLPPELKPHENTILEEPRAVSCVGYFIMRLKYLKADGKEEVITPLLIGQTIEPGPPEVKEERGITVPMRVFLILGSIFLVVLVLMLALGRWYKSEDRRIMERVEQLRAAQAAEAMEGDLFQDEPLEGVDGASEGNGPFKDENPPDGSAPTP